jgi:hypothetical protein
MDRDAAEIEGISINPNGRHTCNSKNNAMAVKIALLLPLRYSKGDGLKYSTTFPVYYRKAKGRWRFNWTDMDIFPTNLWKFEDIAMCSGKFFV